jgi:hypothetical protein
MNYFRILGVENKWITYNKATFRSSAEISQTTLCSHPMPDSPPPLPQKKKKKVPGGVSYTEINFEGILCQT